MKGKLTAARGADRMILIAGIVFFIDSFLAWYGVGFRGLGISVHVSGWNSGGLAVISILFAIAATIFAAIRVLGVKLDLGTVNDGLVYLVLGGGAFLFALLRLVTETHFTKYGLYIAIVAGAFLAVGGFQKFGAKS
ncbi:MAG: hypothetical protein ACXVQY_01070 [Actinomycetota bacterium]